MRQPTATPVTADTPAGTMQLSIHGSARASDPVVLHLHGGAFAGSLETGRVVTAVLVEAGATVFALDYPCGTAHPFPEPLEAAYQALRWIGTWRSRRHRLFVAGEESGGNLAAALALVARDRRGPALAGQILLSPMLDPQLATCSIRDADAGIAGCKWATGWHNYLGTPDKACHPYAAPGSAQRLAGVAPALVLTGPGDPMHDEAELYASKLRESAVPTKHQIVRAGDAWPDALMTSLQTEPPWWAEVRSAIADFLQTAGAVP